VRIWLRLIFPLLIAVACVSALFAAYEVRQVRHGLKRDLQTRSAILAESLQESVEPVFANGSASGLQHFVERFGNREDLAGVAVYDEHGEALAFTSQLSLVANLWPRATATATSQNAERSEFVTLGQTFMHVYALPLQRGDRVAGTLAVFHDASYISTHSTRIWRDTFLHALALSLLISLTMLLILRWILMLPLAKTTKWMKARRAGVHSLPPTLPGGGVFEPLTQEVTHLVRSLDAARAAAEEEARLRETAESVWTAERLRVSVRGKFQGNSLFVVSNREPYMHVRREKGVEVLVPASGLVTALEPVLLACQGTWIAHGSGSADSETVDERDHLRVPPEEPKYTLRRVWLTKEQEKGYYFGFSNEGLWPLCHIAHTRPIFRADDWEHYRAANQKFAEATLEEMAQCPEPAVLVQDYHFALLPALIKEKRPDARVAIFWHIPWPNPEAFGICPWQRELLDGLLGADLIGFHTQFHCNNFLETVDRALESRIERERFAVDRHAHLTLVRPFPISVAFPDVQAKLGASIPAYVLRAELLQELGVEARFLGVGVDRIDYTKGILERFRGIERLLEKRPDYRGQFTFVQIGAPSRTEIRRYQDLLFEVGCEAERINARFRSGKWKPIILLRRHHSHQEIELYFKAADLCMVTSLHDGMNLVAKEFVAARDDEQGVLILSAFAGASRELSDALLVNPYDIEQIADNLCAAMEMKPEERKMRMQRMRRVVRSNNVYRWAAQLIEQLSEIRVDAPEGIVVL